MRFFSLYRSLLFQYDRWKFEFHSSEIIEWVCGTMKFWIERNTSYSITFCQQRFLNAIVAFPLWVNSVMHHPNVIAFVTAYICVVLNFFYLSLFSITNRNGNQKCSVMRSAVIETPSWLDKIRYDPDIIFFALKWRKKDTLSWRNMQMSPVT